MRQSNVTKFINEPSVMRHSNLVLSEGLMPLRVVLCDLGTKYVVWNELMVITAQARAGVTRDSEIIELTCSHLSFDQGEYFDFKPEGHTGFSNWPDKATALENAKQAFGERCARRGVR